MTKPLKIIMSLENDGYSLYLHPFENERVKKAGFHPARIVFAGTNSNFRAKLSDLSADQHRELTDKFIGTALSMAAVLASGGNVDRLEQFGGVEIVAGWDGPLIWSWEELVIAHASGASP